MTLVEDILNGKHFPVVGRERLKATLISLVLLLAIFIMIIDVYESISGGHYAMSVIESFAIVVFIVVYILFPKHILLYHTTVITRSCIGSLGGTLFKCLWCQSLLCSFLVSNYSCLCFFLFWSSCRNVLDFCYCCGIGNDDDLQYIKIYHIIV